MRRANAKHWRVRTEANSRRPRPVGARGLSPRAFRAKRRTDLNESAAFVQ
jgi:hypothetical protein